jgi:hypothetical protein
MPKLLLTMLTTALTGLSVAAPVDVNFINPDGYTDTGVSTIDTRLVIDTLSEYFAALGAQYLPPGQHLKLDVTDIDLAGEVRLRAGTTLLNTRVLLGMADFPRIDLRYELQEGDKVLARGEARVVDMDYTGHGYAVFRNEYLYYERRMLEVWFRKQFAAAQH